MERRTHKRLPPPPSPFPLQIRANDMMARVADKEVAVLEDLCARDIEDRKRCVRLLAHFSFRGHKCLVSVPHRRCSSSLLGRLPCVPLPASLSTFLTLRFLVCVCPGV